MKSRIVFKKVVTVIVALGIVILASGMAAQTVWSASTEYPFKPIVWIVPFAAGGDSDALGRTVAEYVKKYLGNMVVVNRPGGSCTIAGNEVVESPKDGYTVGQINTGVMWQPIYEQTKYDYSVDLEAIASLTKGTFSIMVRNDSPFKNLSDIVAYAKQHPGELKYGHSGYGNPPHLTGAIFAMKAGIKMGQVPFKGIAETIPALLGGHVQLAADSPMAVKGFIKSGEVRVLATSGDTRWKFLPDVPTFIELGYQMYLPSFESVGTPKGIPADVKAKLVETFKKIQGDETFVQKMGNLQQTVQFFGPDETQQRWQTFVKSNREMVKALGIYDEIRKANK